MVLDSGEHVRYLLVDTPEITNGHDDCFGQEAAEFNTDMVLGKEIELDYDVDCVDRYGRQLAYVTVDGVDLNRLIIERGYGCVLFIPPSGADLEPEYRALEATAKAEGRGVWGACEVVTCEN